MGCLDAGHPGPHAVFDSRGRQLQLKDLWRCHLANYTKLTYHGRIQFFGSALSKTHVQLAGCLPLFAASAFTVHALSMYADVIDFIVTKRQTDSIYTVRRIFVCHAVCSSMDPWKQQSLENGSHFVTCS